MLEKRFPFGDSSSEKISTSFANVALIGPPNAGKSTLMNRIVGGRVAAVSRKVNTTRRQIIGVCTEGSRQLAFCDTPGLVERQFVHSLGADRRSMVSAAWGAAVDSDLAVLVVDASRSPAHWGHVANIAGQLAHIRAQSAAPLSKIVLVLNKIDKVKPKTKLFGAIEFFTEQIKDFQSVIHNGHPFMVSAFSGRGVNDVKDELLKLAKPGRFLVNDNSPAAFEDMREVCVEHIWEKLLHCVHAEIPYMCTIENELWTEDPDGEISTIEVIRVPRPSQKPIILGPDGSTIRWITEQASLSASQVLNRRVNMKIRVALAKRRQSSQVAA